MLLIFPPLVKPSEPPAGIAKLAACLHRHDIQCHLLDLNIETFHHLFSTTPQDSGTFSKRAIKNRSKNIIQIQSPPLFTNFDHYQKCVFELNKLIELHGTQTLSLTLSNYQDTTLSPLQSDDLIRMAEYPHISPFYSFFKEKISGCIEEYNPSHVGISLLYLSQALSTFCLIGIIKKLSPQTTITVGGGLMTSWRRSRSWNEPFSGLIDHCIDGSGEDFLLSLFSKEMEYSPSPEYETLYSNAYLSPGKILPYATSSGCYWSRCSFCPERAENNRFIPSSPDSVLSDLRRLTAVHSPDLIHFLDNAIPPAVIQKLAQPSNHYQLPPWYGFVRATHHFLEPDFCRSLKKSGCVLLKIGIESGDQRVLDVLKKGTQIQSILRILENLKKAGISTYIYLLFGTPEESYENAKTTRDFIQRHHDLITFLNLAIFNMPINSPEHSQVKTGLFYEGDLSLYTSFEHPHGWNRKEVRSFLDKEVKRVPEIAAIIRRDPPFFTSNHAPFLINSLYHFGR